jgi:membrane protein
MTTHRHVAGPGAGTGPDAPPPDADVKPDSPTDLTKPSWKYSLRKSVREFLDDECTDLAAALTYYAVLSIFPALLALVSVLGLVTDPTKAVDKVVEILKPLVSAETLKAVQPAVDNLASSQGAGFALIVGLALALWSASGYVTAFSRAMNRIYEIREGRPFWKLRPIMLLITLVAVLLIAIALLILILSGPVAESVGDALGIGSTVVTVWRFVKWPVLLLVMVLVVALLYYATPNIKQPKFRWVSIGAVVAIGTWLVASVLFGIYVASFSNYEKTYGSLGGVIAGLLWLWITNLALLLGAEMDSEVERSRELQAGIPAERELQLPLRDDAKIEKAEKKEAEDIERGRELRLAAERNGLTDNEIREKKEK